MTSQPYFKASMVRRRTLHQVLLALLITVSALFPLLFATPADAKAKKDDRDNIDVSVSPESLNVVPGATIGYKIRIKNKLKESIGDVDVILRWDWQKLTPSGSDFNNGKDWVSDKSGDRLTVTFGGVDQNKSRSAMIYFKVNPSLVNYTKISMDADYKWGDKKHGGDGDRDVDQVTVIDPNQPAPQPNVNPTSAPAGTVFHFYANHYAPGEAVVTWLNTPNSGVQALDLQGSANEQGEVWFDFDSQGLQPGAYSLVLYGSSTQQTGVVPFIIQ